MAAPETLRIEVVYALPHAQRVVQIEVAPGTTVGEALRQSGLQGEYPQTEILAAPLGIFGRRVGPDQVLRDGDRIEIYRPLHIDPKDARRARAVRGPA